jgi:hypothetical protein
MLIRKVNNSMLVDQLDSKVVYIDNGRLSVEVSEQKANSLMSSSDEIFEIRVGLIITDAEHELFLSEIQLENELD